MKIDFKGFLQVVSSNILSAFFGIGTGFLLPLKLSTLDYGYWQYFLLYSSYVGVVLMGYCDGIYLRYGGSEFTSLDKKKFSGLFYILVAYLIVLASILVVTFVLLDITDRQKLHISIAIVLFMLLFGANSYFTLLNQAVGRFSVYATGNLIDRGIVFGGIIVLLFIPSVSYIFPVVLTIGAKVGFLIYNFYKSGGIIFAKPYPISDYKAEIRENISGGFPLTVCAIISMLMTGFGRMYVEGVNGIIDLAYYSFAFSSMSLIGQLIVAAAIVLFPVLMKSNDLEQIKFIEKGEALLNMCVPLMMMMYFPLKLFVALFLPNYSISLPVIVILLPVIIFQSKINIIYTNLYKVKRKEMQLMFIGGVSLLVCIILSVVLFKVFRSIESIAIATSLAFLFWYHFLKIVYNKKLQNRLIIEVFLTVFISINCVFGGYLSFILSLFFVGLYYYYFRKELKEIFGYTRFLIQNKFV